MGEYIIKKIKKPVLDENEAYTRKKLEELVYAGILHTSPEINRKLKQEIRNTFVVNHPNLIILAENWKSRKNIGQLLAELKELTINPVSNAINNGTTFYTEEGAYAVDNGFFYIIDSEYINYQVQNFREELEKAKKENISEEEIANLFEMNYCINIVGLSTPELQQVNQDFREYLKELIKIHGAEKVKAEFKTFFIEKRKDEDEIDQVDPPIKVGKYKKIMRHMYLADLIKEGIITFSDLKELESNKEVEPLSKELFEQIYEPEKGSLEYFIDSILYRESAKTREEAIEFALKKRTKVFTEKIDDLNIIVEIAMSKIQINSKIKEILKNKFDKISIEDLKKLDGNCLKNVLNKNLLSTSVIEQGLLEDCFNREQLMAIMATLSEERFKKFRTTCSINLEDLIFRRYDGNLDENNIPIDEKGLTFQDILELKKEGYIKNQDIIKLFNATDKIDAVDKKRKHIENIAMFYSYDKLMEMLENGEINQRFIENYKKFIEYLEKNNDDINFNEIKKQYFHKIKEDLENSDNPSGSYIALLKSGLKIDLNHTIPMEEIIEAFLVGEITDKDIIALFKKGAISSDTLAYSKEIKLLIQERRIICCRFNKRILCG